MRDFLPRAMGLLSRLCIMNPHTGNLGGDQPRTAPTALICTTFSEAKGIRGDASLAPMHLPA